MPSLFVRIPLLRSRETVTRVSPAPMPVFVALAIAATTFASQVHAQQPAKTNNIVAVVNADPISRRELSEACLARYGGDVLDNMVNRHLILQACQKQGIKITETDVREEIHRIASKFGLSMESYLQLIHEERDISPNEYSTEVVWPMLALRRLVADRVQVTQEEYNRAYLAQFGEAVKCRMIMVGEKEKATSIHQRAAAQPEQFPALAKEFSEDGASASVGGLIPPIRRFSGDSRLEEEAFALQNDQVSEVLQLGDQWIILQAVRRIPRTEPSPQALPTIRAQITDRIRDGKMRGAASELFSQLQKESQVQKVLGDAELTRQHPGVAAIINGQKVEISLVAAECVKRHGLEVLDGEINRKLLTQALKKAGKAVAQADIDAEVANAATRFGFVRGDGSADLDAWTESVLSDGGTTMEIYLADAVWPSVALKKLVQSEIQLTPEDLQQGFESAYGPRVEVLAIVLSDQRSAQKIWQMARDNPTEEFFGQLAEQYSIEPVSSSNRGKVPPIRKHSGQPAIEAEAFKLKPGQLSGIVVTGDKYIILRCQGFTEPIVTELSEVREELIRDLTEQKTASAMASHFEALHKAAEIDNFLAASKARVAARPEAGRKPTK